MKTYFVLALVSLGGTSVTLSDPTLTSLTANWKPAGGDGLTGYRIEYSAKKQLGSTVRIIICI